MCDMGGIVSSAPQDPSTFAPNTMGGPVDTSTFGASQPSFATSGSAPITPVTSQFLPGSIGPGGGGAVGAPGPGAPSSSPAGFAGPSPSDLSQGLTQQSLSTVQSANPAAFETAQNVLNAPDPNAPISGVGGGVGVGGGGGGTGGGRPGLGDLIAHPSISSLLNFAGGNLGTLANLGILGFEAANKPGGIGSTSQQLPAQAQPGPTASSLLQQAGTLQTAGQALSTPLATGVLPPGPQAAVDQLTKSEQAQIRNQFANMGLSGSTMEATALSTAAEQAQARGFQIAQQMAQQGLADMNLSSFIFDELMKTGLQNDQEFQQALSQFASSLAGGGGGQSFKIVSA